MRFSFLALTLTGSLALTIALSSCTSNYPLKSVDYSDLFCDGNSKVWLVDKMIVNDVDVTRTGLRNKEVFIFHDNGVIDRLPLHAMGQNDPKKARYYLDSDKKTMSITFRKQEEWMFKLSVLEEERIIMRPLKKGSAPFTLELIPLPEL
ncbi:MAG: hypothetical protein DCO96_11985 [Fluviicola sp. XM-24bin1]|nr:MAG: hypothetical protein DCO96_11985 [Fluviicola sp. XM-24bin1]